MSTEANSLPKALQALAGGITEPRKLYLPELAALLRAIKSGVKQPFPGLRIDTEYLEEGGGLYRARWTGQFNNVTVSITSGAHSDYLSRRHWPRPEDIADTLVTPAA